MLTETDMAYLAGLIDGEGAIGIYVTRTNGSYRKHRLTVNVTTTDCNEMAALAAMWGRTPHFWQPTNGDKRWCKITWTGAGAVALLRSMQPYIRLKRRHVELVMEFASTFVKPTPRGTPLSADVWAERERIRMALSSIQVKRPRALGPPEAMEQLVIERPLHTLTCAFCGKAFAHLDQRRRYCSDECKGKATYQQQVARGRKMYTKPCPDCGNDFETHRTQQVYCSPQCGPHGHRNRGLPVAGVKHGAERSLSSP